MALVLKTLLCPWRAKAASKLWNAAKQEGEYRRRREEYAKRPLSPGEIWMALALQQHVPTCGDQLLANQYQQQAMNAAQADVRLPSEMRSYLSGYEPSRLSRILGLTP